MLASRFRLLPLVVFAFAGSAFAETKFGQELSRATFKLVNPGSTATVFILTRTVPASEGEAAKKEHLLVTAAHVLAETKGEHATLELRRRDESGEWSKLPVKITIRDGDKPLWRAHETQDAAVMRIELPPEADLAGVGPEHLATDDDWKRLEIAAGDEIRCVGFPHGNHFSPTAAGFPIVRTGSVAHIVELPTHKHRTFHCSFNIFEGDSGSALYLHDPLHREGTQPILGVVSGQHFLDEQYKLVYVEGKIRQRLGLAIVVHASAIQEVIEKLDAS